MKSSYFMVNIGIIHSPFIEKDQMPIQASRSDAKGWIDIFPEYQAGLQDLDGFSHIILIYVFHHSSGYKLSVQPFLEPAQVQGQDRAGHGLQFRLPPGLNPTANVLC